MKKIIQSAAALLLMFLMVASLQAQSPVPGGINYQAIARNSSGSVYVNSPMSVRINKTEETRK